MTTPVSADTIEVQLAFLVKRYNDANGLGMSLLNLAGGRVEGLLDHLPEAVRNELDRGTLKALEIATKAAANSRNVVRDQPRWINTLTSTAMGVVGGAGGVPSALAELPMTTTVLLRSIQGVAAEYGFDPSDPLVQSHCLQVFSSAGPLIKDDGADTGFLMTRLALTGGAVQKILAQIAPKLAAALGQKLALQSIPVLGAVSGAVINYTYTEYYQEIAHVQFGLRALARDHDADYEGLVREFAVLSDLRPAKN